MEYQYTGNQHNYNKNAIKAASKRRELAAFLIKKLVLSESSE